MKATSIILATALCIIAGTAKGQVKIGNNPQTINAASNLEVEAATANRKVSVNKTTGQVTIADGTEGYGKILVSDSFGNASWQPAPGTTIITGANNMAQNFQFITPPGTTELVADCPITLNKGVYTLYYYVQFDYYVNGSTTTARPVDLTSSATFTATFPRYIYFDFVTTAGTAVFPSYGMSGGSNNGPHVIPVIDAFQVAAKVTQLVSVTADNTVIKPRYWGIPAYGRVSNIGQIIAVKM